MLANMLDRDPVSTYAYTYIQLTLINSLYFENEVRLCVFVFFFDMI